MTNEEILKKAIEKAVKGGWEDFDSKGGNYLDKDISGIIIGMWHIEKIIFSHSFAKAFWGEKIYTIKGKDLANDLQFDYTYDEDCMDNQFAFKTWQYHLTIMTLKKEPLKYLEKFL